MPLCSPSMWVSVFISALLGFAAGRSIVAETSAHRRDLPDRWWDPLCDVCDGSLTVTMTRCSPGDHRQRASTPLIPIVTAAVLAALAVAIPSIWLLPAYLVFGVTMVTLTITDLDTKLIPNRILAPATVIASILLIGGALADGEGWSLVRAAAGGAIYFLVMFLLALVARGGLGFGDVKLAFLIGVFTGYLGWGYVIIVGVGAFVLGGLVAVFLLITRRSGRKDAIPFGPFMTAAAIIAVVFGDAIIAWYLR